MVSIIAFLQILIFAVGGGLVNEYLKPVSDKALMLAGASALLMLFIGIFLIYRITFVEH